MLDWLVVVKVSLAESKEGEEQSKHMGRKILMNGNDDPLLKTGGMGWGISGGVIFCFSFRFFSSDDDVGFLR